MTLVRICRTDEVPEGEIRRFELDHRPFAVANLGDEAPPDVKAPGFGDALVGLRLGRAFRGLGRVLDARHDPAGHLGEDHHRGWVRCGEDHLCRRGF